MSLGHSYLFPDVRASHRGRAMRRQNAAACGAPESAQYATARRRVNWFVHQLTCTSSLPRLTHHYLPCELRGVQEQQQAIAARSNRRRADLPSDRAYSWSYNPVAEDDSRDSCSISVSRNVWSCRSQFCMEARGGKAGGNMLDLVALLEGCSVRDAALRLQDWSAAIPPRRHVSMENTTTAAPDARCVSRCSTSTRVTRIWPAAA